MTARCFFLLLFVCLLIYLFIFIVVWDRHHQKELTDKKEMDEVVDVKAQLMFACFCAHICIRRRGGPVALWFLGS